MTDTAAIQPTAAPILELVQDDCLRVMRDLPDGCVDLVVLDLPYETVRIDWDKRIDMDALWSELRRIITPTGTIVATGTGLFTVDMINAGRDIWKYNVIWQKSRPSQFVHGENRPLCDHEDVMVFSAGTAMHAARSKRRMTYHPIGAENAGIKVHKRLKARTMGTTNCRKIGTEYQSKKNYPRTVQYHPSVTRPYHPTEKPVSLMEWIVSAYSNPGDLVLDPSMGSGTAGAAAVRLGRHFFGIERDANYFDHARTRILAERDKPTIQPVLCLPAPANDASLSADKIAS